MAPRPRPRRKKLPGVSLLRLWRRHSRVGWSVVVLLLAGGLSTLSSQSSLSQSFQRVALAWSHLWHHVQWTLFTEGKVRLQLNENIIDGIEWNWVRSIEWNSSVVDHLVDEGNDVTQSFFISEMVKDSRPALIKLGPAAHWPLGQWDMWEQIISGSDMILEGVRWQKDPLHMWNRDREPGGMLGSANGNRGPVASVEKTLTSFLESIFDPGYYLSWQIALHTVQESGVLSFDPTSHFLFRQCPESENCISKRLLDWTFFQVIEDNLVEEYEKELVHSSKSTPAAGKLWSSILSLSHPGVVWQTAFEPRHKFISQVQGSSSFVVFPPEEPLYLYPDIHRLHGQSQLPMEVPPSDLASREYYHYWETRLSNKTEPGSDGYLDLPKGSLVMLNPGDTLYIPPYWHHRQQSESLSLTVTVNSPTCTDKFVIQALSETDRSPLGVFAKHSDEGRAFISKLFLGLLLAELHKSLPRHFVNSELKDFALDLYNERYRPIYPPSFIEKNRNSSLFPKGSKTASFCPPYPSDTSALGVLLEENIIRLSQSVKSVAELFVKAGQCFARKDAHIDVSVDNVEDYTTKQEIDTDIDVSISKRAAAVLRSSVRSYFERIARFAVGPQKTVYFIYDCLN